MKKNNIAWMIISVLILLLQIVAEVLTAVIILRLNMLPDKYTVVLAIVLGVLVLLTALLLFVRGKKPVGNVRRIIACVLALLISCGCALLSKVAADAYHAMHAVTTPPAVTNVRDVYVFVRNDDPAKSLTDTADYTYAIVQDYDVEHTQQAIAKIEETIGKTLTLNQYMMTAELADALFAKEVDALILNGAAVTLLMEEEAYADFTQKTRILHTMTQQELQPTEPSTEPSTEPDVQGDITNTPFVVYISGSDTRSSKLNVSRSDVNILVVVNPVTKQVLLLNTPRDYYVPNPAGNGKLDKLTHCGLYGTECSMETLENLYDVQIDYYAQINFTGFETLVDAVGGVTVYSDQSFTARDDTKIKKGENTLNGKQALDFARERYRVTGGDNGRGKNQMKVIKALIGKLTSGTTIISNYSAIISSLEGMFKTSITMDEISLLVKMQLNDLASWNVQSFAVVGQGGSETTYSAPGVYAYVMHPNEDVVAYAGTLIDRVLEGETLTEEDVKLPEA